MSKLSKEYEHHKYLRDVKDAIKLIKEAEDTGKPLPTEMPKGSSVIVSYTYDAYNNVNVKITRKD